MTTRVAAARLPNTSTARPGPRGLKSRKWWPRMADRAPARAVLPARRAAAAARAIWCASAESRAASALAVSAGIGWSRSAGGLGYTAAVVAARAAVIAAMAVMRRSFIGLSFLSGDGLIRKLR